MQTHNLLCRTVLCAAALLSSSLALADYPTLKEADWTANNFRFHTGEVMPALRIHYTTVGAPSGEPVLVLHGTAGSGSGMLTRAFAGELFGPGQPLDATKYFVILPDALGAGKSSRPSDGLRAKFPRYDYDDMVLAQYRLVTEGLGIRHLRLVLGNSMGGMHAWIWGVKYPDFMDALVPMACQPSEMSGRNWMMRRMLIDAIRKDPDWKGGDYVTQPHALQVASTFFGIATIGGSQAYYKAAPTREKADKLLDDRLAAPFPADANDYLYQWEASEDYNPAPGLDRIRASVLAINSADDERNPPELGIMEHELPRIKGARLYLIPGTEETRGHGTTALARFWKAQVSELLNTAVRQPVKTVLVNGYPMVYQDAGTGVPLVLVHGALNDYRIWYAQLPEFTKNYRVINVSLRHYYPEKWDGQGGGFLIIDHAEDVAALIKALNLGKVHLLGHSRGGAVALNVAKLHPEVIRTLILEDASGLESLLPDTPEALKLAAQTKELADNLRKTYLAGAADRAAQDFVDALGGEGTWAKRTMEQRQLVLDNLGTAAVDTGERPPTSCSQIEKFDFPILLVNGERSPKRYSEMFSAMRACKELIPAPVVIARASHAMNRENPVAFNAAVLDFLSRH